MAPAGVRQQLQCLGLAYAGRDWCCIASGRGEMRDEVGFLQKVKRPMIARCDENVLETDMQVTIETRASARGKTEGVEADWSRRKARETNKQGLNKRRFSDDGKEMGIWLWFSYTTQ
ncbi:hypothetical protein ACJ73_08801 [Blastomyces percursus]|uniref:Uncharacterized protein n=1 Tax=Blastomyces percursus TaxID=1658174 RepID=A0A1J9QNG7_9EURO|nr:hypothetical protein ACJ73_08801 [Blastomyces percursus]